MANVKITDLTELAAIDVATNDVLPIVDINNDTTKKVTIASLTTSLAAANDYATFAFIDANLNIVSGNADAYNTQLNANINVVQDNVATNVTDITALETRRSDNVFFTLNLTGAAHANVIINDANVEPTSNNTYSLGAPDKVWKELYLGPNSLKIGTITISDLGGEGITITGASGAQANVVTPQLGGAANVSANIATLEANVASTDTRLGANVALLTAEDTALQARLTTNVTLFTNEDTALQTRIAANTLVAASNDFVTYTRLQANIDLVQDNVATVSVGTAADTETRLNANLDIVSDNAAAVETRRVANIAGAISTVLTSDLTASRALASDGSGKISEATTTLTELNYVNGVTSAIQTQLDAVEARRAANNITTTFTDDVIVTGNLTVNGDTVTINTTNMDVDDTMIMLANGTTGSPANDIGILFNRGSEGNAAFFYDESATTFKLSDTKDPKSNTSLSPVTAANLNVGIIDAVTVKFDGTSVQDAISANVTTLTNEDTALQARLTTNVTAFTNEDAAIEARRVANIAGAISTVLTSDLTADRVMITDGSGKISQSSGVTPTELGYLDGITLGTVAASKAVTADANGDVNFIREVDIDGNVTIGTNASNTVTIVGKVDLGAFS